MTLLTRFRSWLKPPQITTMRTPPPMTRGLHNPMTGELVSPCTLLDWQVQSLNGPHTMNQVVIAEEGMYRVTLQRESHDRVMVLMQWLKLGYELGFDNHELYEFKSNDRKTTPWEYRMLPVDSHVHHLFFEAGVGFPRFHSPQLWVDPAPLDSIEPGERQILLDVGTHALMEYRRLTDYEVKINAHALGLTAIQSQRTLRPNEAPAFWRYKTATKWMGCIISRELYEKMWPSEVKSEK